MKRLFIHAMLTLLSAGALLVSCAKEKGSGEENIPMGKIVLKASLDQVKSTASATGAFAWSASDKVYASDIWNQWHSFSITAGAGTKNAEFTSDDTMEGLGKYAFLAENMPSAWGGKYNLYLSSYYGDSDLDVTHSPMMATIPSGNNPSLAFKHLAGLIKVTVKGLNGTLTGVTLQSKDLPIAGDFEVKDIDTDNARIETDAESYNDANIIYSIHQTVSTSLDVYFPVPTGTYGGFKIKVEFDEGNGPDEKTLDIDRSITIARGELRTVDVAIRQPGSHQGPVTDTNYGGGGSAGDDVSGGTSGSNGSGNDDDDDSGQNGYTYEYGSNTVPVTPQVQQSITDLTDTGFTLPGDPEGKSAIGEGDVFVFPASSQFPGGYAMKVSGMSSSDNGQTWNYNCTQAALDDIFQTLHLEQTDFDLSPFITKVLGEDGREIPITKTKAGFKISIPEIFGGINSLGIDLGENVTVSPTAEVAMNMDLSTDIDGYKLTFARCRIDASAKLGADISIKAAKQKKWKSERLKIIMAAIPIGPVVITPEAYVEFELKLTGEVNLTIGVNYEKAYYALGIYSEDEFKCRGGETKNPDKKDPFSVTGNLSGGIEFGPNLGLSLSLYGGAFGLSVSFNPHMALNVTASAPITIDALRNANSAGQWLSTAFYEPACTFGFGGSIDLLYKWHYDFELPEEVSLAYSFGKTFVMPTLGQTFNIKTGSTMAQVTTSIKNKAIYHDNMYVKVHKNGLPDGPLLGKFDFIVSQAPEKEGDEVDITAYVRGLTEGERYYVEGPFMEVSFLGEQFEVEMAPRPVGVNRVIEYFDPAIAAAVRGIVQDLYASRNGEWEGCNWNENFNDPRNYTGVYVNKDLQGVTNVSIYLDPKLKYGKSILVNDHSSGVTEKMTWKLIYESEDRNDMLFVDNLEIEDKTFTEMEKIVAKNRITIHSPKVNRWVFPAPVDSKTGDYLYSLYNEPAIDLSGTNIGGLDVPFNTGALTFKDCPRLGEISFTGSVYYEYSETSASGYIDFENFAIDTVPVGPMPGSLTLQNCPQFEELSFTRCRLDGLSKALSGTFVPALRISSCVAFELIIPDCCETLRMGSRSDIFRKISLNNCSRLKNFDFNAMPSCMTEITYSGCSALVSDIDITGTDKVTIQSCPLVKNVDIKMTNGSSTVTVSNMEALKNISIICESTTDISLSGMPNLTGGTLQGDYIGGILPEAFQDARKRDARLSYPRKYYYNFGYDEHGEWGYIGYDTNPYGFYYPGEPKRGYHYDPENPNDI